VNVQGDEPVGDPLIDECLAKMERAKRRASLGTWVSRLAGTKKLRQKVARQLCNRGILRADEKSILFIFSQKVYPEVDPAPEREIVERLRSAIFGDNDDLDARTVVLVSLATASDLLRSVFGRKELRSRKARIERIVNGEAAGRATREVIAACRTAIIVAATMPAMVAAASG